MNPIIFSFSVNALWGIGIFLVFLAMLMVVLFWGTSKDSRYTDNINYFENAVHVWPVTQNNFDVIFDGFFNGLFIENMDIDRTGKLFIEFYIKYERYFIAWLIKEKSVKKVKQEVEV